ncbi:MAG TPA: putative lipopolysaccharide heptosyltransferase III [Dissulfurispiraceae bacterium]|nr:putative lipopolysaccharide heptosyltransferase III [Dissulfurispiraceae bacterium]
MREFKDVKNILVIKLRHIGDVLLTVPVFRALRQNFPDAKISALVNSGTQEVLAGNKLIDEIIVFDRKVKTEAALYKLMKEFAFLRKIRAMGFDMTVDLTSGDRAAILSIMSGARYRIAYNPEGGFAGKRYLYTHRAMKDGSLHMVLQNLDVIRQFGISTEDLTVDFFISEDAKKYADEIFKKNSIKESDVSIHIHPTSRWLFKCWKDEYMAQVIDWLLQNNIRVIMTSSPVGNEMERARHILSLVNRRTEVIDLCGVTTLKQLAAIAARSDLFFGVDSAPMHIAAAVNTPVTALFGPSGEEQWRPWGEGHATLIKKLGCKVCGQCTREGVKVRRCLEAIKPEEVTSIIEAKLGLKSTVADNA